jgi:hypothetical protein
MKFSNALEKNFKLYFLRLEFKKLWHEQRSFIKANPTAMSVITGNIFKLSFVTISQQQTVGLLTE